MGVQGLDIERFYRWALGDLVDNRNRGVFAEWLVGRALGAIAAGDVRHEWDAYDLRYGDIKVEVKASGRDQSWKSDSRSKPRFDISPRTWSWVVETDELIEHDPPARIADVYVFCFHVPERATNENVRDPASWKFWVVTKEKLDNDLGPQNSVGFSTLDRLATPVGYPSLMAEVDRSIAGSRSA